MAVEVDAVAIVLARLHVLTLREGGPIVRRDMHLLTKGLTDSAGHLETAARHHADSDAGVVGRHETDGVVLTERGRDQQVADPGRPTSHGLKTEITH